MTACLHFINGTPVNWFSKKQSTVETATCLSEFVATRTCVEQIIDMCNALRCLGVNVNEKSHMFGDNESVVNSALVAHSKLHKHHSALSHCWVQEAMALCFVDFQCPSGKLNPADVSSEHWCCVQVKDSSPPFFHQHGESVMD